MRYDECMSALSSFVDRNHEIHTRLARNRNRRLVGNVDTSSSIVDTTKLYIVGATASVSGEVTLYVLILGNHAVVSDARVAN